MKQIRSMSLPELIKTKAQIEAAIELHAVQERQTLMRLLSRVGASKALKATTSHPLKGRKLTPKYRKPQKRSETWAGRGHKPRWLAAALKSGKRLESFAIR